MVQSKEDEKVVRFKIKYLREIMRQTMLHATQPKPRTWKSSLDVPIPVLRRMAHTLADLLGDVVRNLKTAERVERIVKRKAKGKPAEVAELIRVTEMIKVWNERSKEFGKKMDRQKKERRKR